MLYGRIVLGFTALLTSRGDCISRLVLLSNQLLTLERTLQRCHLNVQRICFQILISEMHVGALTSKIRQRAAYLVKSRCINFWKRLRAPTTEVSSHSMHQLHVEKPNLVTVSLDSATVLSWFFKSRWTFPHPTGLLQITDQLPHSFPIELEQGVRSISNISVRQPSVMQRMQKHVFLEWKTVVLHQRFLKYSDTLLSIRSSERLFLRNFKWFTVISQESKSVSIDFLQRVVKISNILEGNIIKNKFLILNPWIEYCCTFNRVVRGGIEMTSFRLEAVLLQRYNNLLQTSFEKMASWVTGNIRTNELSDRLHLIFQVFRMDWALSIWLNQQCGRLRFRTLEINLREKINKSIILRFSSAWKRMCTLRKREKLWIIYASEKTVGNCFYSWKLNLEVHHVGHTHSLSSEESSVPNLVSEIQIQNEFQIEYVLPPPKAFAHAGRLQAEVQNEDQQNDITNQISTFQNVDRSPKWTRIEELENDKFARHAANNVFVNNASTSLTLLGSKGFCEEHDLEKRKRAAQKRAAFIQHICGYVSNNTNRVVEALEGSDLRSDSTQESALLIHVSLPGTNTGGTTLSVNHPHDSNHFELAQNDLCNMLDQENHRFHLEVCILKWHELVNLRKASRGLLNRIQNTIKYKTIVAWLQHHSTRVLFYISTNHLKKKLLLRYFNFWTSAPGSAPVADCSVDSVCDQHPRGSQEP